MHARALLGRTGEDIAAELYRRLGFTILERNFRCREGEIDLVLARDGLLVFCEVKTRRTAQWGDPCEAVGYHKRARLRKLASIWLTQNHPGAADVRFDVVSVLVGEREPEVTHLPGAF